MGKENVLFLKLLCVVLFSLRFFFLASIYLTASGLN